MERKKIDWDRFEIVLYENGVSIEFGCKDEGVTYVAELTDEDCAKLLDTMEYAAEKYSEMDIPVKRKGWRNK